MTQRSKQFERLAICAVLFGVGVLVFLPALENNFVWDDYPHLLNNQNVKSLDGIHRVFFDRTFPGNVYRPLLPLSLAITHAFVGLDPLPYHLTNVILHCLATIVFYLLLCKLFDEPVPRYAALLFLLHPIHVEAVANISYRTELMCNFFGLGATLLFITGILHQGSKWVRGSFYGCASVFFLSSLLSKESAFSFLLLLPLCFIQRFGARRAFRPLLPALVLMTAVASCYLILRYYALGELFASANHLIFDNPLAELSFLERAVNGFVLLGKYLSLAIFPWRLSADYSYAKITPITDLFGSPGIVELIVILCWTAATVYGVFRSRTFAFWGLWFFCSFIVTANVLIPIGTAFADRLCYLPSAAICGAFATAIAAISQTGKRLFLFGLLGTFFIVRLLYHLPFWYDDEALFSREIIISPESWKVQSNYAVHLLNAGRLDDAMHHYHLALKINPKNVKAMYGIVNIFLEKKLQTDAVHWLNKALAVKPDYVPALILLGEVYLYQEKFAEAEVIFGKALELDSRNPDALNGLAHALQAQKS